MNSVIIAAIITGSAAIIASIIGVVFHKKATSNNNVKQKSFGCNNTQIGIQNNYGERSCENNGEK